MHLGIIIILLNNIHTDNLKPEQQIENMYNTNDEIQRVLTD